MKEEKDHLLAMAHLWKEKKKKGSPPPPRKGGKRENVNQEKGRGNTRKGGGGERSTSLPEERKHKGGDSPFLSLSGRMKGKKNSFSSGRGRGNKHPEEGEQFPSCSHKREKGGGRPPPLIGGEAGKFHRIAHV